MIVVKVELWSAITGSRTEIARAEICNIGGTQQLGDYETRTLRGRGADQLEKRVIQRKGKIERHPRLNQHVWNLVAKALTGMGYGG